MTGFERYAYQRIGAYNWTVFSIGLSGSRMDALSSHRTERQAQSEVNRLYSKRDNAVTNAAKDNRHAS